MASNKSNALADLAKELERFSAENKGLFARRNHLILHKAKRIIAEKALRMRPGKTVNILAYGPTSNPPKTFRRFPSNVMIEQCRATDDAFRAWEGYEVPHGFTVYIYLWGNYPFLGAMAKHSYAHLADFVHRLQRNNVHGIYRCGYGEFYGMEGPGYYVFNNLLETPEADVNALVDEYCERAYGPAAATMRTFHDTIDYRLRATDRIADSTYEHGGKGLSALRATMPKCALDLHAYLYTPDVVAKLDECLARAEQTKGLTEKQRIRLKLVRLEYDYARTMGRIATYYAAYRFSPTKETFALLGDEIERRNALIARYTKGKAHVPKLGEWPEIRFFGGFESKVLTTNGRLSATIGAPLAWDVGFLKGKGLLPGAEVKSLKVARTAAEPDFADFETGAWGAAAWQELGGCQLQAVPLTARFKALAGPDAFYLAAETDLADDIRIKGCEHDGPAWREESFDLLLDPTGSKDRYYHFIWNPSETSIYDEAFGLITDKLDLSVEEAQVFWPVYNAYMKELSAANRDVRHCMWSLKPKKDETVSDKEMVERINAYVNAKKDADEVFARYSKEFLKVLPAEKVGKLYLAEEQFNRNMVNKLVDKKVEKKVEKKTGVKSTADRQDQG